MKRLAALALLLLTAALVVSLPATAAGGIPPLPTPTHVPGYGGPLVQPVTGANDSFRPSTPSSTIEIPPATETSRESVPATTSASSSTPATSTAAENTTAPAASVPVPVLADSGPAYAGPLTVIGVTAMLAGALLLYFGRDTRRADRRH